MSYTESTHPKTHQSCVKHLAQSKAYPPITIANHLIKMAWEHHEAMTPLKVMGLVYMANGWMLAQYNCPLVNEVPQVWSHGPVFVSIYYTFNHWKNKPITRLADDIFDLYEEQICRSVLDNYDFEANHIINMTWQIYSQFTAYQLAELIRRKSHAWDRLYDGTTTHYPMVNSAIQADFLNILAACEKNRVNRCMGTNE